MLIEKLKRMAREPLIHFLLIGAGIYGLYEIIGSGPDDEDERTIAVSANEIKALSNQWARQRLRPPTKEELASIIRDHVRTQVLYREAVAMGLENGDTVIERRLAQRLTLLTKGLITPEEPSEGELRAWFKENEKSFEQPDLYSLFHVYFNPDKRGAEALDDAKAALAKLESFEEVPADFASYGDPLLQGYYPAHTEAALRRVFGTGFVEQVTNLKPGIWHGPVLSGYGTHLVLVNDVLLMPLPAYEDIKERIKEEWMAEQITELSERFINNLISRYEIVVEWPVEVSAQ